MIHVYLIEETTIINRTENMSVKFDTLFSKQVFQLEKLTPFITPLTACISFEVVHRRRPSDQRVLYRGKYAEFKNIV